MALTLQTNARNACSDAIDDLINTGGSAATLKFETGASVVVATITLQNPAFGSSSTGVITLAGVPLSDTSAVGGTTTQFSIFNRSTTKVLQGTVGVSASDINISSTVIGAGDTVTLTALTITTPAT